jgi:hypothetical protein
MQRWHSYVLCKYYRLCRECCRRTLGKGICTDIAAAAVNPTARLANASIDTV